MILGTVRFHMEEFANSISLSPNRCKKATLVHQRKPAVQMINQMEMSRNEIREYEEAAQRVWPTSCRFFCPPRISVALRSSRTHSSPLQAKSNELLLQKDLDDMEVDSNPSYV